MSGERLRVGVGVEVRVPASSANLGPGFDSVGCALGVWDTCRATVTEQPGLVVTVAGEGEGAVPLDATHLVHRAMQVAWAELGVEPPAGLAPRLPQRRAARPGDGLVGDRDRHRHRRGPGPARPLARAAPATTSTSPSPTAWPRASRATPTTPRPASTAARPCRGPTTTAPAPRPCTCRCTPTSSRWSSRPTCSCRPPRPARCCRSRCAWPTRPPTRRGPRCSPTPSAPPPSTCSPPPASGCTRRPGAPRTPSRWRWSTRLRAAGHAAVISGAGPSVLVLARRDRVDEVRAFGGAGWRVLTPGIPPHGARVEVLSRG